MSFRALQFAFFGLPLDIRFATSVEVVKEKFAGYSWFKGIRSTPPKIVAKIRGSRIRCWVLHWHLLWMFRPIYVGELLNDPQGCKLEGRFQLSVPLRTECVLVLIGLIGWFVLSVVRLIRFGIYSERLVDLIGFVLFLVGPCVLFVLFIYVLVKGVQLFQTDLATMGTWLQELQTRVAEAHTQPH